MKNGRRIRGTIDWRDAIAGPSGHVTYLWGGPSYKGARIGDGGITSKTFIFERDDSPVAKGQPFFTRYSKTPGHFGLCIAAGPHSIYAAGSHKYPMVSERYRIIKETPKRKPARAGKEQP